MSNISNALTIEIIKPCHCNPQSMIEFLSNSLCQHISIEHLRINSNTTSYDHVMSIINKHSLEKPLKIAFLRNDLLFKAIAQIVQMPFVEVLIEVGETYFSNETLDIVSEQI
jgi:hypothetical protein